MKTLIPMKDFVLEHSGSQKDYFKLICVAYAIFLHHPLSQSMFVPCDENDEPLKSPEKVKEEGIIIIWK
jgi:hypothetical protein